MVFVQWLKQLLPPTAPSASQIPLAILQAAGFGLIIGPVLGVFFGWSGPIRAAMISATYCVVFYTVCALPAGYVRKHRMLTNILGIAAASIVMFVIFGPALFALAQIWTVLIMFALGWGQLVNSRQFIEAEKELAGARAHTRALQSRMNPHFFFNTLNTISALIPDDPAAAQRMLGLMADRAGTCSQARTR